MFEEIDKVLFFKDVYTKEGKKITVEQMVKMLKSEDLKEQIIEMMEEEDPEIKAILKCNLPYFMYERNPKLSEVAKQGFFTDNMIMGCSLDDNYDEYLVRVDNVLEQEVREIIQGIDRDEMRIKLLPKFDYPEHIKDPFNVDSELNQRYKAPLN